MKKSLSLLLAIALVFGLFSAAASAATPTPNEAGAKLKELGVLKGDQNGDLMVDSIWKRQDIVVLLANLLGQKDAAEAHAKTHTFTDVPKSATYDAYLSWAKEKGYMVGQSASKFGWNDQLTVKDFSAVVLRAIGIDTTGANYAKTPELAVEAGIFPAGTDFAAKAKRGDTYVAILAALDTEVPGTGKTLGETLGLPGYGAKEVKVAKAAQSGAKKITVEFNRALTDAEVSALTVEVKNGLLPYVATTKVADDKKSADLSFTFLPEGEYTVKVNALDAVTVAVVEEKIVKVVIGAESLQVAKSQDLGVKVLNQFGEEVANEIGDSNITVFSSANGDLRAKLDGGKLDLSGEKVDNSVVATVFHPATGLTASKTFKLVAKSNVAAITLGKVAPLKDTARVTEGDEGLELPYTMVDQFGKAYKLADQVANYKDLVAVPPYNAVSGTKVTIDGIDFVVSDVSIIDPATFATKDGKLTFDAKAAGTVVITALNGATGANATTTIKIEAKAALKSFKIQSAGSMIVSNETVKFPYTAFDSFDAPIAAKDVPAKILDLNKDAQHPKFSFYSNSPNVKIESYTFSNKGELSIKLSGKGQSTIYVWVNNTISSQVNVDVKAEVSTVKVTGVKKSAKTTLGFFAETELSIDQLVVQDNYGRQLTEMPDGFRLVAEVSSGDKVDFEDDTVYAGDAAGTSKVKVSVEKLNDAEAWVAVAGSSLEITYTVVADDAIKTFAIADLGTIYGGKAPEWQSGHAKAVKLIGKLANGTEVEIVQSHYYTAITSSDLSVADIVGSKVKGLAKGTSTITVWNGAKQLASATVTVTDAKPVATSIAFTDDLAGALNAVNKTADLLDSDYLIIKDQYGVEIDAWVTLTTSDSSLISINNAGVAKVEKLGEVTLAAVTKNGLVATIVLND